jgi:membrane glycosyltransferase
MQRDDHSAFVVLVPVAAATGLASGVLSTTLAGGPPVLDVLLVGTFTVLFAWIAFWLWVGLIGAFRLVRTRRLRSGLTRDAASAVSAGGARTAIVIPIHNEDVDAVFARLQAMLESVSREGAGAAFEAWVLSDTSDADATLREELAWARLRAIPGLPRVHYRRRTHKFRKKSGNVADFCKRWGGRYEYMVVLDADSVMHGSVLIELVRRMDAAPRLGILQAPSALAMQETLYGRLEQFAATTYGPAVQAGLAYCFGASSNFWGHNAIVRLAPFAEYCGLPGLSGRPPFGGPILSHDFVEAALMRRAGYEVRLAWDLTAGSYEQGPASFEIARERDLRWCRGNLQHLRLVLAPGFSAGSRAHFAIGIFFYAVSALWAAFVLLVAARYAAVLDGGNPPARRFVPLVLAASVTFVLVGGKVFAASLSRAEAPRGSRRLAASTALEIVASTLAAPVRMVSHLFCLIAAVTDTSMDWAAARREGTPWTLASALRLHGYETFTGVLFAITLLRIDVALALWLSPIWVGLVLSIPLDAVLSSCAIGRWCAVRGLFVTPAEAEKPPVIARAEELLRESPAHAIGFTELFQAFVADPWLNALHTGLLRATRARTLPSRIIDPLLDRVLSQGVATLSPRETMAILSDAEAMKRLHENQRLLDLARDGSFTEVSQSLSRAMRQASGL